MKIVIMAGGKGTRIASLNFDVPKPMIPILDKPILEHQISSLSSQGYTDFILVVGHQGDSIRNYFGNGEKFNVNIEYVFENTPLGTAGALFILKDKLKDDFLLLCGDLIFDVDITRFYNSHKKNNCLVTLFTHPNSHPYDSGIIISDNHGRVVNWLHKEDQRLWYRNRVNAGLHFISPKILEQFTELKKIDLDRDILKPLIESGKVYVYDSPEYVKDIGTPERYQEVIEDLISGKVSGKNLAKEQKAIFLDRDGTINKYIGFLNNIDDFELEKSASSAIRFINNSGYLAIVVTNQPVIARGEVTEEQLDLIHNKMETLLGHDGAYVDAIYYCPHHPDKGFIGEKPEYKIDCNCRKPNPGMLLKAAEEFNINLSESWIIGDEERDVFCGKNARCKTAIIGNNKHADITGTDLKDCVNKIFEI